MTYEPLKALPYFGGKMYTGSNQLGKWIAQHLKPAETYVEPFAGMLGIYLQTNPRDYSHVIINDIDSQLYNWWVQVRDNHNELCELLEWTPHSEEQFNHIKQLETDSLSLVQQAWRYTILATQSFGAVQRVYFRTWNHGKAGVLPRVAAARIAKLAERIHHIHIHNTCATTILQKIAANSDIMIYADPPYPNAGAKKSYTHWDIPVERMLELLKEQKGKVAISGYVGDPWENLDWQLHTKESRISMPSNDRMAIECLWTNYNAELNQQLF